MWFNKKHNLEHNSVYIVDFYSLKVYFLCFYSHLDFNALAAKP